MEQSDVVIIGGGLTGPLLALALAQGGLRSSVVDAMPLADRREAGFDGRAYALSASSWALLRALGLMEPLKDKAQAINDIRISDGRPGEGALGGFLHFADGEIDARPMGRMIEDRYLRPAILEALDAAGIAQMNGFRAVRFAPGQVTVAGPDGTEQTITARLTVGCDGRKSAVAQAHGIRRLGWDYGQTALVCALEHAQPHHGCAYQFFTPSGPLAVLPLPGNRSSIVWTEHRARAEVIAAMEPERYLDTLRPVFGDFLGPIALAGGRHSYPLGLSLAERLVGPGLALAGDAGHGIHPLAGQGLNLGMRDIAALAEVLVDASRRGEDIAARAVLERYQRWRRFDIAALAASTDGINRLFSNDNPVLRGLRDLGLRAVGRLPGLRRELIRTAAGLSGDQPRLLAGRPL